jgi:hypothetical protein
VSIRKLPPDHEVLRLVLEEGRTLRSVADEYGATRQAVSACLHDNGAYAPNAVMPYREWIPWRVRVPHNNDKIVRRLRRYARWQMGETFSEKEINNLSRWISRMRQLGVVVDYDPKAGFFYSPRRPDEPRDALIRQPA